MIQKTISCKPLSFRFILTATLLGNTLEWYDIVCFGFLAPLFETLFFPKDDAWWHLFHFMLWFSFGSLLRPFGGIFFGFIGDRYGRKIALISSIILVSIPALGIGLLPTYWQIGAAAPILLAIMRLIQGIAIGGELPGAVTFLTESSLGKKRGFYGSFAFFGVFLGALLGGIDYFFLNFHLTETAFKEWGWRIIFFIGAIIGAVAFLLRRKLHETPVFRGLRESHEILDDPLKSLFAKCKIPLAKVMGIYLLEAFASNLVLSFSMVYYIDFIKVTALEAAQFTIVFLVFLVGMLPVGGFLASKFGAKKVAVLAAWGYLLFSLPIYWMMEQEYLRIFPPICLGILLGLYLAPLPTIMYGLFPGRVRFSGIALGINLPMALLGGFTPLLSLSIIMHTGFVMTPAIFLMIAALASLLTFRTIKADEAA